MTKISLAEEQGVSGQFHGNLTGFFLIEAPSSFCGSLDALQGRRIFYFEAPWSVALGIYASSFSAST